MSETDRVRRACADLERSVLRAARSIQAEQDLDAMFEKITGGRKPEDLSIGDWWERKVQLNGWLRHFLALQLARGTASRATEFLRLRAFAEEPERVELTTGRVVACYPLTYLQADRLRARAHILGIATYAVETLVSRPLDSVRLMGRLDRERLYQRAAMIYEATLPAGSVLLLPIDPPLASRIVRRVFGFLDGVNRKGVEFWRTRGLVVWTWSHLETIVPLGRWFGLPPAWAWAATPVDELGIMRAQLLANDERLRALPDLPTSGSSDRWDWSGFISALAEQRHDLTTELLQDRSLVSLFLETATSADRARKDQAAHERERKATKTAGKGR